MHDEKQGPFRDNAGSLSRVWFAIREEGQAGHEVAAGGKEGGDNGRQGGSHDAAAAGVGTCQSAQP
jgi:hypothetical protein